MLWRWVLAAFFIFSFTIGTSMIMIPYSTSIAGFWPSLTAIIICYIYLMITGFYYLEATLSVPHPASNVFSISHQYMGKVGAWGSSLILALTVYANLIYYFSLSDTIFGSVFGVLHLYLARIVPLLLVGLLAGILILSGTYATMLANFLIALIMCILFYLSFKIGFTLKVPMSPTNSSWLFLVLVIPSIFNTLYFHTLIPTIAHFLNYKKKLIQMCIIVAFTFAMLLFTAWLFFSLTPRERSYEESLSQLNPADITFQSLAQIPFIGRWLPYLLATNVFTSILCNLIILVDFLKDVFSHYFKEKKVRRLYLCACALIPTLLIGSLPDRHLLFNVALFITEFGGAYLAGLLPLLWIWSLKYFLIQKQRFGLGRKVLLVCMTIFTVFALYSVGLEIVYQVTF